MRVCKKTSEESFAAWTDPAPPPRVGWPLEEEEQGQLLFLISCILSPLACLEVAGRCFPSAGADAENLFLLFPTPPPHSTLHRAAEAQLAGDHHLRHAQRKPLSPCPQQPPCNDRIIFLPLVFHGMLWGCTRGAGERQSQPWSQRWCGSCHPAAEDVTGMGIAELCPRTALCK